MGILDSIVEWLSTQVMNLLDIINGSVLGALGCDMSVFLRYFPAAETLYEIFVAIAIGFILLNLVWQLFKNFGVGIGLSAEDPIKLTIKSMFFILLAYYADEIVMTVLKIAGTPYAWIVDAELPAINFGDFGSVLTVIIGSLASGSVALIVLNEEQSLQYVVSYVSTFWGQLAAEIQEQGRGATSVNRSEDPYWLQANEVWSRMQAGYDMNNLPLLYLDLSEYLVRAVRFYLHMREQRCSIDRDKFDAIMQLSLTQVVS